MGCYVSYNSDTVADLKSYTHDVCIYASIDMSIGPPWNQSPTFSHSYVATASKTLVP